MALAKALVRTAVITALAGGTAVLIAGPERVGALFSQARQSLNHQIDQHIQDPIALRAQLKDLEGEYPHRIADVRADLAELQAQKTQLARELEVSERVVQLSRADADELTQLIAHAEGVQATLASTSSEQVIRVNTGSECFDLKDAYAKANKVRQVHNAYVTRAEDIRRDMGYLGQQEQRLASLLDQLQSEHAEFQTQMWQLDRQVDTIARNDRLIDMMEKRQKTLDSNSRYSASSIDQVHSRFADIRARQEARLEALGTASSTTNYEDRAKFELDSQKSLQPSNTSSFKKLTPKPAVIEIGPADLQGPSPQPQAPAAKPIALGNH